MPASTMTSWQCLAHSPLAKVSRSEADSFQVLKFVYFRYPTQPIIWHQFRRHGRDEATADYERWPNFLCSSVNADVKQVYGCVATKARTSW